MVHIIYELVWREHFVGDEVCRIVKKFKNTTDRTTLVTVAAEWVSSNLHVDKLSADQHGWRHISVIDISNISFVFLVYTYTYTGACLG
jgi:hypothetical protein